MTIVQVTEGMKFQHNPIEKGNEFEARKYDFYGDGEPIWCAFTEKCIYPLDEICINEYIPMVDGKWVNEPVEYRY